MRGWVGAFLVVLGLAALGKQPVAGAIVIVFGLVLALVPDEKKTRDDL